MCRQYKQKITLNTLNTHNHKDTYKKQMQDNTYTVTENDHITENQQHEDHKKHIEEIKVPNASKNTTTRHSVVEAKKKIVITQSGS